MSEQEPGLMRLHHAFAQTDYGIQLDSQVRFERYKPADVTNQRWTDLLGADVNNLEHMSLTRGLVRSFVRNLQQTAPDSIDEHESRVLETAAIIHDWGEAITGDVTYDDNTDELKTEEYLYLEGILNRDRLGIGIEGIPLREAMQVIRGTDERLGHVFNTVERVGYVRTGIRASECILSADVADCEDGLSWLVENVLGNHVSELIARSEAYPPVKDYLLHQSHALRQAFALVSDDVFENYSEHERADRQRRFAQGKNDLDAFLLQSAIR